jgi:hypothetical protein
MGPTKGFERVFISFIRVEGLIPKNPLARGSLWGGHKGIKVRIQIPYENNIPRRTEGSSSAAGVVD